MQIRDYLGNQQLSNFPFYKKIIYSVVLIPPLTNVNIQGIKITTDFILHILMFLKNSSLRDTNGVFMGEMKCLGVALKFSINN